MKTSTNANESELGLTAASGEELQTITGGSIDGDVPQCGNVIPRWYPSVSSLGSIVSLPAVQNTWAGR